MASIGYEHLRQTLNLGVLAPARRAIVKPVTRLVRHDDELQVPAHVAPRSDSPLQHILFALKHEGTDLSILAAALPRVPAVELAAQLEATPNGAFIRKACYLWEHFTGQRLEPAVAAGGPYVPVFDPTQYLTSPGITDPRWRVRFNGLGTLAYCPTVRRTAAVEALLGSDILARVKAFADKTEAQMLDRALTWAYLHETESSFAIEHEAPSDDKARTFIALLKQAHERRPLSEQYLVELQNSVMTNPWLREVQYRTQQNWLKGPARGATGVTYVPPPPDLAADLMDHLLGLAAQGGRLQLDPLVHASLVCFGFVFIHPFMDGNGRLSRFLFHHTLCMDGALDRGLLLPVSVAIKRNEKDYLAALQAFSRPARELWSVLAIDEGDYRFSFNGNPCIYRYWDATLAVEFGLAMAQQALEVDMHQETVFLAGYDEVLRRVEARYDVRGSDLAVLVMSAHEQQGRLSSRRRKQYAGQVQPQALDYIEQVVREVFHFNAADGVGAQDPPDTA